jgi:beta-lactamase class A
MRPKKKRWLAVIPGLLSIAFFVAAGIIGRQDLDQFNSIRSVYAPGLVIADIPVGGLTQDQASQRLMEAYSVPVELHYAASVIQVPPDQLGFSMDLTDMLAQAEIQRTSQPFWDAFWGYLWDFQSPEPQDISLSASVDEAAIRAYLANEISPRYDQPPQQGLPVPASTNFNPGTPGTALDIEPAVPLIVSALKSLTLRTVDLTSSSVPATRTPFQNLGILFKQVITTSQFAGVSEIYLQDLKTGEEIHIAYQQGKDVPLNIGFTAASTIKIPIMISTFRRIPEQTPPDVLANLKQMIEISENDPADWLMKNVMDQNLGPLDVSADMAALGLKDTFLGGFFYTGAPLLKRFQTPANQRTDIFTGPDPYNQTTPAEIGRLLADIYQCANTGEGPFATVFPGQLSQAKCKQMITLLIGNHLPQLLTAGLPEGTQIAHKHGWIIESDGLLHTIGDAGIIFTPRGDFVMTVYLWQKDQLLFDPANILVADMARAAYNYFNQPVQ